MNTPRTCPQCQKPMPDDAPEGLCPSCLMQELAGATNILPPGSTPSRDTVDIADATEVAKRLPQFEIIELLGRGGMGVVYKVRQPQLDRIVALKILPPEESQSVDFVERFRREARSLAKLNHPNIVSVHDFGEGGGLYYIVMEFVEGANLRQLIQSKQLSPAEALAIVPKICDALQFAHEEGVMHRDIKPENILVDKKGRVKIADFGLAKLLHHDPSEALLTMSGMTLGTPRYMAPEQVEKPESVDHRADIYSLGVVFYEMLTGELPMGRFDPPSKKVQVDVKLDDIVLHALEKEPARRYQHASEIKTDVQSVAGVASAMPTSPAVSSTNTSSSPEPRLSRMALIGAIWAVVGFGTVIPAVLIYLTVGTHSPQTPSSSPTATPLAYIVMLGLLVLVGAGAPIGTTILGAVSMGNIKRSGGKLYGLPLAFADTVFFPMLLLHGAMAVMLGVLIITIMKVAGVSAGLGIVEMGLLAMLPLIADFFIVRALWRKVTGHSPTPGAASMTKPFAGSGIHLALCVLLSAITLWFVLEFGFPVAEMITGPDFRLIEVGRQWHLGSTVDSIFSKVAAILALLGAGTFLSWRSYRRAGRVALDWSAKRHGLTIRTLIVAGAVSLIMLITGIVFLQNNQATQSRLQDFIATGTSRIVAEKMGALEPEQYRFRYQIHTPPDHRVVMWMETTRNGKPVVIPGLANNISTSTQLSIGERFDGDAEFSLVEGSRITPDSKGKWRWDFKHGTVGKNTYRISPGGWIDNPFAGMGTSVHQGPKLWEPKPGEEVSILVIRGGSHSYSRDPTEEPPAGEIELRLKARIDPVPLFHRVQGSVGSSLRDPFPTPSTPLGRIAAGFRLNPNLPEDEIRRQMIAELTSNDSKRTNAEAILKSVGKPVTRETKPEDVLKALEDVAQAVK